MDNESGVMSYTVFGLLESGHCCNSANRGLGTNRF